MGDGLDALLAPGSIAVIGASEDTNRISGRPIEYLRRFGFGGDIYPINPNRQTVQGLRSYSSCADVPGPIDLAVIAIPGESVLIALQQCAEKGVKACIIFSSGFAEVGEEGRRMQERISEIATRYGMRVLGPNCQGVVNFRSKSAISFSTSFAEGDLLEGSSAILSQSGAVAAMVYNLQKGWRSGAKYWVASGNEADVSVPELLDRVVDDPDVRVVQAYMKHIKDHSALESAAKSKRLGKAHPGTESRPHPGGQTSGKVSHRRSGWR